MHQNRKNAKKLIKKWSSSKTDDTIYLDPEGNVVDKNFSLPGFKFVFIGHDKQRNKIMKLKPTFVKHASTTKVWNRHKIVPKALFMKGVKENG